MKLRVIVTLAIALCLGVGSAGAHSIGIFTSSTGGNCRLNTTGGPINYYVLALLDGPVAAGITGAEFRIDLPGGMLGDWAATSTKNAAANVSLGDIWGGGGNIAFPSCQPGSSGILTLYSGKIYPGTTPDFSTIPGYLFTVQQHSTPSNPNFACPLFTQCDGGFSLICTHGGSGILNAPCTVAVSATTWGALKGLYKN